jgi:two-component system, sensor histidine kinase LadS
MLKIVFVMVTAAVLLCGDILHLRPHMKDVTTFSGVYYLKDPTKKLDIRTVRAHKFILESHVHLSRGVTKSNWWLKFKVQNSTDMPIDWILKFNYSQFNDLESWQFGKDHLLISHIAKGSDNVDVTKTAFDNYSTFEFHTLPKTKNTIYIKLAYTDAGFMEMYHSIWTKDEFVKSEQFYLYALVGLLSALIILLLYNIFLWLILRKKEYFWYNAYVIGVILTMLTFNHIGVYYLWNQSPYLKDMMPVISVVILFVSFVFFTRAFLETAKLLPKVDKFLKALIVLSLLAFILASFSERYLAIKLIQFNTFAFILFPVIGFILWYRGYQIARGYAIASTVLSLSILLALLRFSGVLQTNELLFWFARFGFVVEGILLSIALADRITILENNYKNSQDKAKNALEEAKKTLILEVKKRTRELEIQTNKAEELARTDEMTGIWNRRAFLERGEEMIYNTLRYKTPFSLIIIDIDHFKLVNDHHGHEAGDIVLKTFAHEILKYLRDTDFFGRIGGEEFVVLLPYMDSDQAFEKAKILLQKIRDLEIIYKEITLKITVSMGVCEFLDPNDTLYSLLSKADKALYYVKAHGRNNVQQYF